MEKRLAVIAIVLENDKNAPLLNAVLHEYSEYIVGRMGIPMKDKGICLISIAIDAPTPIINALTGKIGRIEFVSAKTAFSKENHG